MGTPATSAVTADRRVRALWLAGVLLLPSCLRIGYRELDGAHQPAPGSPDAGLGKVADAGAADSGNDDSAASGGRNNPKAGGGGAIANAAGSGGASGTKTTPNGGSGGQAKAAGSGGMSALMDAGSDTPDAALDAGSDAAINPACPEHPEAVMCDGFEDPELARWSYPLTQYTGMVELVSAPVRTGTGSLHATTGAAMQDNAARYASTLLDKQMSGDIWLRYYDYLPSSTVITTHFSSGVLSELSPPYDGVWVMVLPNRVDIGSWISYYQGNQAFPRDRWVCVELHVHVDATNGLFELFLDKLPVASSGAVNSIPSKGYTSAEIGIHYAEQSQGPVEVYVDDVVISRVRVPCD